MSHPLLDHLLAAAGGRFPSPDGGVTFVPALDDGTSAVVSFTAHAIVATALDPTSLLTLGLDGYGGALSPPALMKLAGDGEVGVIDVTLCARGVGGGSLPATDRWDDHPRVHFARRRRVEVAVHGDESGLVTLARGLAGRREMSIETPSEHHGVGIGRHLIGEALALVPEGEWVFAAVSPGNARSLRAFLARGFVPIGSEVLLTPPRTSA